MHRDQGRGRVSDARTRKNTQIHHSIGTFGHAHQHKPHACARFWRGETTLRRVKIGTVSIAAAAATTASRAAGAVCGAVCGANQSVAPRGVGGVKRNRDARKSRDDCTLCGTAHQKDSRASAEPCHRATKFTIPGTSTGTSTGASTTGIH